MKLATPLPALSTMIVTVLICVYALSLLLITRTAHMLTRFALDPSLQVRIGPERAHKTVGRGVQRRVQASHGCRYHRGKISHNRCFFFECRRTLLVYFYVVLAW